MAAPSLLPEHLLAAILSSTEDGLLGFALDGTIHTWSKGAEQLYGYAEAEIIGQPMRRILPQHEVFPHEQLLGLSRQGTIAPTGWSDRLHKNGSTVRVALTRAAVRGVRGEIVSVVESGRLLNGNSKLLFGESSLRPLLEQMPVVLWTTDQSLRITSNWGSGMRIANIQSGDLVGRSMGDLLEPRDAHAARIAQQATASHGVTSRLEVRHHDRDFEICLEPLRDAGGKIVGCMGVGIDITERKKCEEQIRHQATHDALTGLANYRECLETLEREVRRADRSKHSFAVLFLDLDDLKQINDRCGHLAGNRALRRLAGVLKAQCRSTDLAARYGGDEFAILLIDADPGMARQIAERVESALEKDNEQPPIRVSIGIGIYPDDGRTASELLEAADQDLYRRKRSSSRGQSLSAR